MSVKRLSERRTHAPGGGAPIGKGGRPGGKPIGGRMPGGPPIMPALLRVCETNNNVAVRERMAGLCVRSCEMRITCEL